MADDAVIVSNPYRAVAYEEASAAGAFTPGYLIEFDTSGNLQAHSTAAEVQAISLWADLSPDPLNDKSDAYAADDVARAFYGQTGMVVDAFIASGETISAGDDLVSAGDGTLAALNTAGGDAEGAVIAKATEAVSPTGGAARCEVRLL